ANPGARGRRPRRLLRRPALGSGRRRRLPRPSPPPRPARTGRLGDREPIRRAAPFRAAALAGGSRAGLGRRAARLQGLRPGGRGRRHPPGGGRAHRCAAGAERHLARRDLATGFRRRAGAGRHRQDPGDLGAGRRRAAPERLALSHLRRGGRAHEPARPGLGGSGGRRERRGRGGRAGHRFPHVGEAGPPRHQRRFHGADARQRGRGRPRPGRRGAAAPGAGAQRRHRRRQRPPDARQLHGGVPRRVLGSGERLLRLHPTRLGGGRAHRGRPHPRLPAGSGAPRRRAGRAARGGLPPRQGLRAAARRRAPADGGAV
ncbi:MAG: 2-dehydropantoate 2-reductase, partial [uncultured Acetobacteraceae bacterium]